MTTLARFVVVIGTAALFAGCSRSVSPIGVPPLVPQAEAQPTHAGRSQYQVLFSFGSNVHAYDGFEPEANLINFNGSLYGTTAGGGSGGLYNGHGTVFRISTSGKEKVLYSFKGSSDGSTPRAALVALHGVLYGTTFAGGGAGCGAYYDGCGVVFGVTPTGEEKVLHRFGGVFARDGIQPSVPLVAVGKYLYGTTYFGGAFDQGTIFRVTTDGKERIVHNFHATTANHDGAYPMAGLINVDGVLYGTASEGQGRYYNGGAVFKITTSGRSCIISAIPKTAGSNPMRRWSPWVIVSTVRHRPAGPLATGLSLRFRQPAGTSAQSIALVNIPMTARLPRRGSCPLVTCFMERRAGLEMAPSLA